MARIVAISGESRTLLDANWQLAEAPAGGWDGPAAADSAGRWLPAAVPGTVAQALEAAGLYDRHAPVPLHDREFWFRVDLPGRGPRVLHLDGLATLCEVFVDGVLVLQSASMFLSHNIVIDLTGESRLHLRFLPLTAETVPPATRRPRWKPTLIADAHMRQARSTLIGHMPGWCPDIDAVGPWRPVTLVEPGPVLASDCTLSTSVAGRDGVLDVALSIEGATAGPELVCGEYRRPMHHAADGRWQAKLRLPDVALWWPHTHGTPALHEVAVIAGDCRIDLGRTGFRTLAIDRGADGQGFAPVVNGVPVFCRGANWTGTDLVTLANDAAAFRPLLELARDAGMNMLRVPGVGTPVTPAFHDVAAELGLMVWHDLPLANFDYDFGPPDAPTLFGALVRQEVGQLLDETETSPALAVVCGGSEIAQQGAMLSLPRERWKVPFLEEELPALVAMRRPDVAVVPSSPWGGDQPFYPGAGVTHYYGVGAYCRPPDDARRAGVRFASECLAFANLPQPDAMRADHAALDPTGPEWKARVVSDLNVPWTFEDSRDHYLHRLYGFEAATLKRDDPALYVRLSQAVSGEIMEATFAEWRRAGSMTAGALVWMLSDPGRGFGWGVVDWRGAPKPAWYALRRAFRPVTLVVTDEGLNGLDLLAINESDVPRAVTVVLSCLAGDGTVVIDGRLDLDLAPRETRRIGQGELLGIFYDATFAYRFGPPAHVVTVARLFDRTADQTPLAEAFHFPLGRGLVTDESRRAAAGLGVVLDHGTGDDGRIGVAAPDVALPLRAELAVAGAGWVLSLTATRLVQALHIACPGFRADDDWFHLAPGATKTVRLAATDGSVHGRPSVTLTALDGRQLIV